MTKEELLQKIKVLEVALEDAHATAGVHTKALEVAQKQLEDLDKPKLTPAQVDNVFLAIERGLDHFDFDNFDNYNIEYGIDYDGRVTCESFSFDDRDDVAQEIFNEVCLMFNIDHSEDDCDNS